MGKAILGSCWDCTLMVGGKILDGVNGLTVFGDEIRLSRKKVFFIVY